MVDAIAANHRMHAHEAVKLCVIKEIANTTKHWDLLPTEAKPVAAAVNSSDGTRTIQDIPSYTFKNSDHYEYYRSADQLPQGANKLVVGVEISGPGEGIHKWPDTALSGGFGYVEGLISTALLEMI